MKRYCLINSISGILSVELMMRYCPDNIGKDTIRRVSVQLFCAPPHSGNCFWNYMHPAYIESSLFSIVSPVNKGKRHLL